MTVIKLPVQALHGLEDAQINFEWLATHWGGGAPGPPGPVGPMGPPGPPGLSTTMWFNVKASPYNAVGDNSHDDTANIQAAIDAASGGGVVYFPKGTYRVSAALNLPVGVRLLGDGQKATIIHQTSTSANGISLTDIAEAYTAIENLQVQGPGSGTGTGVWLSRTTAGDNQCAVDIADVLITSFGGDGLFMAGAIASTISRVIAVSNGRDGFRLERTGTNAGTTSTTLMNCYANANVRYGYAFDQNLLGSYSSFVGCAADSNDIGYYIHQAYGVSFFGCGAEVSNTASWKWDATLCSALSGCISSACKGVDLWATNNSQQIEISSSRTQAAGSGHTYGVRVDSGSHAILSAYSAGSSTQTNLLTGDVIFLNDTDGLGTARIGFGGGGGSANDANFYRAASGGAAGPATDQNLLFPTLGTGVRFKKGTSGAQGVLGEAALVNGTVTVPCAAITTNSLILIARHDAIGTYGELHVTSRVAGVSFTIESLTNGNPGVFSGEATLVSGTKAITGLTWMTAATLITLTRHTAGGTIGDLTYTGRTAGVGFTINSASGTDTSVVTWMAANPIAAGVQTADQSVVTFLVLEPA